jgi:hypothetical protein
MSDELSVNGSGAAVAPSPADWRPFLSDELKADPVVSEWATKTDYKDIPSLIKGFAHGQKRFGSAINLPGKDAKPEEMQALKQKLMEAGVMPTPPTDVSVYKITKPEKLADGLGWNDELAKSFGDTLLKHGASPDLAKDMLALYETALTGVQTTLNTTAEASLAALKAEHGEKFDERMEAGERLAQQIFTDPDEIEFFKATGVGRSPRFQSIMMRLAPLAMQDSSFVSSLSASSGSGTSSQAFEELQKIQTDKTHPMHVGYTQNDPKVMEHIMGLYRKAHPGTVELG